MFNFSVAMNHLLNGEKIARKSWVTGNYIARHPGGGTQFITSEFIYRGRIDSYAKAIWEPTQVDLLAGDWILVSSNFALSEVYITSGVEHATAH